MIVVTTRAQQKIGVLGLGSSGIVAARALKAGGANVTAWDDNAAARQRAQAEGLAVGDLVAADWRQMSALVMSPGIPLTHPAPHPAAQRAIAARKPVIGDIELLAEACPQAHYIGITGTNGKSTTTALIGHLLKSAGRKVEIGGNLGTPALSLSPLGEDGTYVLELSSYQLDLTQRATFNIAVLLNLSPDHLDRHGDMDGYIAAKLRIFRTRPGAIQTAVVGVDDARSAAVADRLDHEGQWRVERVSQNDTRCDVSAVPTLPGAHNRQNAAAAYAAGRAAGIDHDSICSAIATYPGLPHRQETVAVINGIRYVNDSKATNADAAAKALACYDTIYWIAGGLPKADGLGATSPYWPRIRRAFLIGKAADEFGHALSGKVAVTQCGTLDTAIDAAHALAQREARPGAVVLLSPACASFDQWKNFEARGDAFRVMAHALKAKDTA
jgi:UDP-N-acetylmuramoylalanine--D-glutamate ligase